MEMKFRLDSFALNGCGNLPLMPLKSNWFEHGRSRTVTDRHRVADRTQSVGALRHSGQLPADIPVAIPVRDLYSRHGEHHQQQCQCDVSPDWGEALHSVG